MTMAADGGRVQPQRRRPFLEHLESYLARRDGVDKLLKISRYAARLALAAPTPPSSHVAERLRAFEASVGSSRKAFRLGKFVQDLNALRGSEHSLGTRQGLLELIAYGGEGIYYFVEQFVWLAKAGLIDKRHLKQLQKVSAWTEFIGYFGSVLLKLKDVSAITDKENRLIEAYHKNADGKDVQLPEDVVWEIKSLQIKRFMKTLSLIQDFSDALLALSDIRDGRGRLSSPFLLSIAGLVSALISTHKNWLSC